jgi:hypothetical protein
VQGEALVQQDGTLRTFPPHSSWFEILAVLREGIRDLGHKLRYAAYTERHTYILGRQWV